MADGRRDGGVERVVAQHLLGGGELERLARLAQPFTLLLLLAGMEL